MFNGLFPARSHPLASSYWIIQPCLLQWSCIIIIWFWRSLLKYYSKNCNKSVEYKLAHVMCNMTSVLRSGR